MKTKNIIIQLSIFMVFCGTLSGQVYQWRGPDRNGIYPGTGLKKSWPEEGPKLVWSFEGLGTGHSSIGPGKDRFFTLGMSESTGVLYAFNYNGKLLWKKSYGPEWNENYEGSRSTPVVADDLVYFQSGYGVIYCYNANTGEKIWTVDLQKRFNGRKVTWGMVECLLIDGEKLFCTPGGIKDNIAALNRFNGETIWTSPGNKEPSAYCPSLLVRHNNAELIVTATAESIVCVDAGTGEVYWHIPQSQTYKIHANAPLYSDGVVYYATEEDVANNGLVALKLSEDGKKVTKLWRNQEFRNVMGGYVLKGSFLFGSVYEKNTWCCIDITNGKIIHSFNKFGDGSIIMADGLFYCYSMKGEMGLMYGDRSSFRLISSFRIPMGEGPHFSHPVIYKGRLYVRHGNALMVYDVTR